MGAVKTTSLTLLAQVLNPPGLQTKEVQAVGPATEQQALMRK